MAEREASVTDGLFIWKRNASHSAMIHSTTDSPWPGCSDSRPLAARPQGGAGLMRPQR
jgi:hypothetical protein